MANINITQLEKIMVKQAPVVAALESTRLPIRIPVFRRPVTAPMPQPVKPTQIGNTSMILGSRNTRPLWFDGRFLAAADVQREQNYFLRRQAYLSRDGGFGVVHGLTVDQGVTNTQPATNETIVIRAGDGITPSGELVMISEDLTIQLSDIADEENLDEQFGLSEAPQQPARTRTGIYVIALRGVQFSANPISTYPANLSAPRITHDGDIVEATAVSLVPYPNPVNNYDTSLQRAALAWGIFVQQNAVSMPDSLLPIAMISLDRNVIQWVDTYLVRRDSGPQPGGVQLGLADPATQQAFLLQYNAQLQTVAGNLAPNTTFAASNYFRALPPAGPIPLSGINAATFTQTFFPQQTNVTLSLIPSDELPAMLQDSMSLPPIDLTLAAGAYANMSVLVLVPVARNNFAAARSAVQDTPLAPALPQTRTGSVSFPLIRLLPTTGGTASSSASNGWPAVIGSMAYGYYLRLRDEPIFVDFTSASASTATSTSGAA